MASCFRTEDAKLTYLLDTNAISLLMREDAGMAQWLACVEPGDRLLICTIVRGEVLFGLGKMVHGQRRRDLEAKAERLFDAIPCEAIPPAAADHYSAVKLDRQSRGLSLDENDLWVAATALAIGATLVSRDKDFEGIPALTVLTP